MRRLAVTTAVLAVAVLAAGCGSRSTPTQPTVASVDFTPKAEITVDDAGLAWRAAGGPEGAAAEVGAGSVVEVRNAGTTDHRVQGTGASSIDTGVMRPGDTTTVVLATTGSVELHVLDRPDATLTVDVTRRDR